MDRLHLGNDTPTVSRDTFEQAVDGSAFDPETWPAYRKVALTRAMRVEGPFTVQTSEGPLKCEDGYVAVDARGYPYPIAADEFALIYQPAAEETAHDQQGVTTVPWWNMPANAIDQLVNAKINGVLSASEAQAAAKKILETWGLVDAVETDAEPAF